MANSVYAEFKRMMTIYGEDSIKELMPLIVTILEALDRSLTECNGMLNIHADHFTLFFR